LGAGLIAETVKSIDLLSSSSSLCPDAWLGALISGLEFDISCRKISRTRKLHEAFSALRPLVEHVGKHPWIQAEPLQIDERLDRCRLAFKDPQQMLDFLLSARELDMQEFA
jgi:hypothetical protein